MELLHPLFPAGMDPRPAPPRYQRTRFQRQVSGCGERLAEWATNPWRRLSLLLIVLLIGFVVGGGLGSITGALSYIDQVGALVCVLVIEAAARLRAPLLRRSGDRLGLQLLDMARVGVLYGLLLDGFKLL
jgi:hypothetical protein